MKLIDTSREALNAAIEVAGPGINVGMIGYAVQTTIENRGYKPIANLTGHGIKRYNLHSGISVPNGREWWCSIKTWRHYCNRTFCH